MGVIIAPSRAADDKTTHELPTSNTVISQWNDALFKTSFSSEVADSDTCLRKHSDLWRVQTVPW